MEKQTIGDRLRQIREEQNLTSGQVACKLKIDRRTWLSWEHGDRFPTVPMLMDICETFNVSADWLLGISERIGKNECDI